MESSATEVRPDRARAPAPIRDPGIPKAEDASVNTDASSIGGDEGRGLLRGWWAVCWGACKDDCPCPREDTEAPCPWVVDEGRDGEAGGSMENVIEPPAEWVRICGLIRWGAVGVGGA